VIDYFALALTHALIMIALFRILVRDELDREDPLGDESGEIAQPTRREARRARRNRTRGSDA
jgi:hypothetical protein